MPKVHNKYHNTASPDAVYIGRPSPFGNPFSVEIHGRERAVALYKDWILDNPYLLLKTKRELAGKDLVCYCSPKACHGDILLEIANGTPMSSSIKDDNEQEKEDRQRS